MSAPIEPDHAEELSLRLATLRSLGEAIARGDLSLDQRSALQALLHSVEGLERRCSGDGEPLLVVPESTLLQQVMEDALVDFGARAALRRCELVFDCDAGLPHRIAIDAVALREALHELVGGALRRAGEDSEVVLRVSGEDNDEGQCILRWTVFDPSMASLRRRDDEASALRNLPWSQALAETHGGRLEFRAASSEGGNEVELVLQLCTIESTSRRRGDSPLRGVRVLVVDDNANMRRASLRLLESLGCRVSTAECAGTGFASCRQAAEEGDPMQLALIDLRMPGRGGFHLARDLAESSLPVPGLVLLFANHRSGDMQEAQELGFQATVRKPLKRLDLESTLLEVLRNTRPRRRTA